MAKLNEWFDEIVGYGVTRIVSIAKEAGEKDEN